MAVTIDRDTCIGCSACVGACPVSALSMDGEGKSVCDVNSVMVYEIASS